MQEALTTCSKLKRCHSTVCGKALSIIGEIVGDCLSLHAL